MLPDDSRYAAMAPMMGCLAGDFDGGLALL